MHFFPPLPKTGTLSLSFVGWHVKRLRRGSNLWGGNVGRCIHFVTWFFLLYYIFNFEKNQRSCLLLICIVPVHLCRYRGKYEYNSYLRYVWHKSTTTRVRDILYQKFWAINVCFPFSFLFLRSRQVPSAFVKHTLDRGCTCTVWSK